ncbi:hypothetical protein L7F22_004459 [Adiantum nelumboides]|nr:hypothetical protein [Adiantum nelumboides]
MEGGKRAKRASGVWTAEFGSSQSNPAKQNVVGHALRSTGHGLPTWALGNRDGENRHVSYLLERMREEGIQPDEVLLLRLLSACSHAGLVERGQIYFESAGKEYDMVMTVEHVNCMMDLLSRAGQLDESVAMTQRIPCVPDVVTWTTMLGACRKWGNLELGLQAFEGAANLDDYEAALFVLLSNIYASDTRGKPTGFPTQTGNSIELNTFGPLQSNRVGWTKREAVAKRQLSSEDPSRSHAGGGIDNVEMKLIRLT